MGEVKIEADLTANARNLQYLATELQGIVTCPACFGQNRSSRFSASLDQHVLPQCFAMVTPNR
jgi:hypothetical protein